MKYIQAHKDLKPCLYSQGILTTPADGELLFVSGQLGKVLNEGGVVVKGEYEQTKQALKNILAIVRKAKGTPRSLVKVEVYIKDSATSASRGKSREHVNKAYEEFFLREGVPSDRLPTRTMVWVAEIPLEFPLENTLVEISAIAVI